MICKDNFEKKIQKKLKNKKKKKKKSILGKKEKKHVKQKKAFGESYSTFPTRFKVMINILSQVHICATRHILKIEK
jgi:hypothetical protein